MSFIRTKVVEGGLEQTVDLRLLLANASVRKAILEALSPDLGVSLVSLDAKLVLQVFDSISNSTLRAVWLDRVIRAELFNDFPFSLDDAPADAELLRKQVVANLKELVALLSQPATLAMTDLEFGSEPLAPRAAEVEQSIDEDLMAVTE